ncbi:hypothetical protein FOZ60_003633 [Perkinsus olseni]|uniref:Uncharacterized protein n=1 Tax=Perkinsus olseni TaxID=32597 RepID=A0A7J6NUV7_PEROL|nr:hypothetical protein FOZ60_003633 [Perkinsus olseni]
MPSTTTPTPALRYFKLPNKDRYAPAQVLRSSESGHAMFIIVEAHIATVCAPLLGDSVHYFNLDNRPFLGAWIPSSHKTQWRISLETVPIGKNIGIQGRPLAPEDVPVDLEIPTAPDNFDIETSEDDENDNREFLSYSSRNPATPENAATPATTGTSQSPAVSPSPQGVTADYPVSTSETAANAVPIPNGKVFTGIDDQRPISDILKAANEAAACNAWTSVEEINPQPQATAAAYGTEVRRLCSLLHHQYSSETELVKPCIDGILWLWAISKFYPTISSSSKRRGNRSRLQGGPIDERVLKHKLLMTLPTVHREVGLNKMASVGYHELLHELIQLDRVRQLANAHRKTGHQANNPKFISAVDTNNNAFCGSSAIPTARKQGPWQAETMELSEMS